MKTTQSIKKLLIAVIVVFTCMPGLCGPLKLMGSNPIVRWAVQKSSILRIKGSTNVAGFGCEISGYYQSDTITYSEADASNNMVPLKGSLNINVNNFDCHHAMLTSDLRKTLKAKEFPNLVVRFISLQRVPVFTGNKDALKGQVEIELSGICKRFDIHYKLEKTGSLILLNGVRSFCFSDFNLTPPKKFGGLVRVKDDFDVDFRLMLTQVN